MNEAPETVEDEVIETEVTEEKPETPEGFVTTQQNNEEVGKQYRLRKEAERSAVAASNEAKEAKARLRELEAAANKVEVPPPPDPYATDYAEQVEARDEALRKQVGIEAQQANEEAARKKAEQAQLEQLQEAEKEQLKSFDSNMLEIGLNPVELHEAGQTVANYGVSEELTEALLTDPEGPLFVAYLAQNPLEIEKLEGMPILQRLNHLNTEVRQRAALLRPQTSKAPDPPITLTGGGVQEMEDPELKGVIFE